MRKKTRVFGISSTTFGFLECRNGITPAATFSRSSHSVILPSLFQYILILVCCWVFSKQVCWSYPNAAFKFNIRIKKNNVCIAYSRKKYQKTQTTHQPNAEVSLIHATFKKLHVMVGVVPNIQKMRICIHLSLTSFTRTCINRTFP